MEITECEDIRSVLTFEAECAIPTRSADVITQALRSARKQFGE